MKYKYVYAKDKILIEAECVAFLEDMSKQGWKLKRVFYSLFIFERYDIPLKYQLDYSNYDEEYVNVITDLGYEYLCLFNNIKFYCHKNLDAVDLQTDSPIYNFTILKRHSVSSIISDFICILIFFVIRNGDYGYLLRENTIADFYINFNIEVLRWCLYALIVYFILNIIKKIDIRYKIKHIRFDKDSLICFHPVFRFSQSLILIIIISLILFLLFFGDKIVIFLGIYIGGFILTELSQNIFLSQKYDKNHNSKKNIILTRLVAYSLCILSLFLIILPITIHNKAIFIWTTDTKPYYEYQNLESSKQSHFYLTKIEFSEGYVPENLSQDIEFHNETYYEVKDKKIAQIIFEQIMIDNEFYTNESRITNIDLTGDTRKNYIYNTYEQVINKFHLYKTANADICYYYKDRLMAIKNNRILDCFIDNKDHIDDILKYYFE